MGTCLTTTLRESVMDNDLLKLGELRFSVIGNTLKRLGFTQSNVTVKVKSPGYITDSTGTSNLGATATTSTDSGTEYIYLAPGNYDVVVNNKGTWWKFSVMEKLANSTYFVCRIIVDCNDFFGATALRTLDINSERLTTDCDLKSFSRDFFPNIVYVNLNGGKGGSKKVKGSINDIIDTSFGFLNLPNCVEVTGDISTLDCSANLLHLDVANAKKVTGNISGLADCTNMAELSLGNTSVSGNISYLSSMTAMTYLTVYGTKVYGNLASLSTCTNLRTLNVSNTDITGDTSSLANLTNLTTFNYANTAITGTWPLV